MAILNVSHVSKRFGGLMALDDVSLSVEKGEAVVIIGSSGSGKSTLPRCVNDLERVTSGQIEIDGQPLMTDDGKGGVRYLPERELRPIRMKTCMVFQHFNLFPHLTCLENVTIAPIKILGRDRAATIERGRQLLDEVGLLSKADTYPAMLSGGQQQRVAIARAMAMDPQLMLFDEPTSALDPEITNEVVATIQRLVQQRRTMIIVTHDMRFARESASRVVYMDAGRIVEEGTPDEIFTRPRSERLREFIQSIEH